MRLQQYLNENITTVEELNELIHKNCKYYLKLTEGKYIFKRGMSGGIDTFGKKKVRQNRRPLGMEDRDFYKLNIWLDKNNHVRRDKAVIATNITSTRSQFGEVYWMFPIGKFNYTWLKANDMNITDYSTGWDPTAVIEFFRFGEVRAELMTGNFEDYFTTNKNIKIAYRKEFEIWFNCKEYYYVKAKNYKWNKHTQTIRNTSSI